MKKLKFNNIELYQSEFELLDSNMYVLVKNSRILVVDPHYSSIFEYFLNSNHFNDITILLTHEHPDHTSGIRWLSENYKIKLICSKKCANIILDEKNNRPILISFVLSEKDKIYGTDTKKLVSDFFRPCSYIADIVFNDNFRYEWEEYNFYFKYTPGHSFGSVSIILNDDFIFTGDSLLKDTLVITRFPGGSMDEYMNVTLSFYKTLSKELIVLPGHGDIFDLKEKNLYEGLLQ